MVSEACLELPYGVLVEAMSSACPPYAIVSMHIFLPGTSWEGMPRDRLCHLMQSCAAQLPAFPGPL